jgi:hypothetical protein
VTTFLVMRGLGSLRLVAAACSVAACIGVLATPTYGDTTPTVSGLRIVFTGKGGGRYLDVTRWLHDDTRECYARRTADETLAVSWRIVWTVPLHSQGDDYVLGSPARRAHVISGRVRGSQVRDSCDAAEEEDPGWTGSSRCDSELPLFKLGSLGLDDFASGLLDLRGPTYGSPSHPCELSIRNDQLEAHVGLTNSQLDRIFAGKQISRRVGTDHPGPGDDFLGTRSCSAFPHIYDGVVYLYDCDDTLVWSGSVTILPLS